MNRSEASLLGAHNFREVPRGVNAELAQVLARPSIPYLSPFRVVTPLNGPFGVMYWIQGLAIQTCDLKYITAPEPTKKSGRERAINTLYTQGQYVVGSAPTKGVFTGVEETC